MRRKLALMLAVCLGWCFLLTGCGEAVESVEQLQVVCTIFPEYDWTRRIVGDVDGGNVTLLIKGGTDLHSYQPSVKDIAAISQADVFCYVGGASDQWVTDVLETAENDTVQIVSMMEAADANEEVIVEGMQEEGHHHHEHDDHEEHEDEDHDHEEEEELDEHVWLSLRRAQPACEAIRDALCEADPAHAAQYRENCTAYISELQTLDGKYQEMMADAVRSTILVADRFPFRYLAEDYDLTYYAAFPGCSAETEASFETIVFLTRKLEELELPCILTAEGNDQSLARTVLENADSNAEILVLNSLQSVTQEELDHGVTYLSRMEENLEVLQKALTVE